MLQLNPFIQGLPKHFEAQEKERFWNERWQASRLYAYNPEASRQDSFVVDTPPPTVSGSLHLGHVFSYSHTDFIVRYQRMRGLNIFYPIGWDDNGLPTERRVQNVYNVRCDPSAPYIPDFINQFQPQKDRPALAVARQNFIELCDQLTKEDEKVYKQLWQRLGLSFDWSQEYATIHHHARRLAQFSFLDLWQKGHLYMDEAPIMWDVDFQTSIAQAEIEDRELSSHMHRLFFFQEDGTAVPISTTRPELLPACVAVVVHPNDTRYQLLHDTYLISPLFGVKVPMYQSELVDPSKGTGVVMVCTFGDATDVEWWRSFRLPLRQVINLEGRFGPLSFEALPCMNPQEATEFYEQLLGKTVVAARKTIIALLANNIPRWQWSAGIDPVSTPVHRMVKFYEKGDKPLEFIASRQWFVRLLDKKNALLDAGDTIQWEPAFAKARYRDWTTNLAFDWNISRQRYFGVPVPVWFRVDKEGKIQYEEPLFPSTDQLPIDPSIHIPAGFNEAERGQANGFTGEVDVFDTWFTSSLTPQLSSGWVFDPSRHEKLFPADIRPQSHEIIRTWAFYTIVKSLLHENSIPWKRVLISGWVTDADRKKMSKSKGNVETPESWIDQYGADGVRYWAAKARIGVDTIFDPNVMKNGSRLVNKLFNAAKFVYSYPPLDGKITQELDLSFLCELHSLVEAITSDFDSFDHASALQKTEQFFWEKFTDNYLEMVKSRVNGSEKEEARTSAVLTLHFTLNTLLRAFAPFLPYITEEIWSWQTDSLSENKSIHLAGWPSTQEFDDRIWSTSPRSFSLACQFVDEIKRHRAAHNLSFSIPLGHVLVRASEGEATYFDNIKKDLLLYAKASTHDIEPIDNDQNVFSVQVLPKR